ncbi:hypothetical protein PoB_001233700 [Plakobranchus ocellatus]|uniref:Uncharacterized protein n=1 Tax=Plakobranchus ocellatus TaxID=259542 RepID=A0AAV3YSC3_9GAST|nr:hypothetical protein PoB_001233700 [Plakobranchus ocellatus]
MQDCPYTHPHTAAAMLHLESPPLLLHRWRISECCRLYEPVIMMTYAYNSFQCNYPSRVDFPATHQTRSRNTSRASTTTFP